MRKETNVWKIIGGMMQTHEINNKKKMLLEEIDFAETIGEANYLLHEYQLAYGSGWVLRKVQVRK